MLTYKQAYDKIIEAYFKDQIKPLDPSFCFCGNLCDNSSNWYYEIEPEEYYDHSGYSGKSLYKMEKALFDGMADVNSNWSRC